MVGDIQYLETQQLESAYELIKKTFDKYEGNEFSKEGSFAFYTYMEQIKHQFLSGDTEVVFWGYFLDSQLVGVCALIKDHIGMLFVDELHHRQGIATQLIETVKAYCRAKGYQPLTINAFPYAIPIYHHMGFQDQAGMQEKDGMFFVPMYFNL